MSVAKDFGEELGKSLKKLTKDMANDFKGQAKGIASEFADYRNEAIPKMNEEAAAHSIDENMFRTKEFHDLAVELKERLKHSPEDVPSWFNETLGGIFAGFYDMLIGLVAPASIDTFEDAKSQAGYLTFLCIDMVILVAALDLIATAASLTLIRNLVHIGRLFVSTFGLDRYISAVIAPALQTGMMPMLTYGFNERYQVVIPGPTDLIRMELREVFRPEFRDELLTPGTSETFKENMKKQGFNDYWSNSYWAAHWVLPSLGDLDEMLHRGIITDDEWETMVRRNDYLPAWIPNRKKITYNPYTRVDGRRMWDLALLTEEELLKNYKDLGYDDEHAEKMTIWTKVYVLASELRARYSKGWITKETMLKELTDAGMPAARAEIYVQKMVKAEETERTSKERDLTKSDITRSVKKGLITKDEGIVRLTDLGYSEDEAAFIIDSTVNETISEEIEKDRDVSKSDIVKGVSMGVLSWEQGKEQLTNLGYSDEQAEYILSIRVAPTQNERVVKERDLTKAEIVKGVKKGILTVEDGVNMLVDMGYSEAESEYIIAINVEALTGSPHTWAEFQDLVIKHNRALGRKTLAIPDEIKDLEKQIKDLELQKEKELKGKADKSVVSELTKRISQLKRRHKHMILLYTKKARA